MPERRKMKDLDLIKDILGISLPLDRIEENQQSYKVILEEIKKLRTLDLSNEYPAVVFSLFNPSEEQNDE